MTALPSKLGRDPLASIPTDLPSEDGENMESAWHRDQMVLLIESLRERWKGRQDFYCGGNMFIHFSPTRARNRDFRGPDFFAVLDVDGTRERDYWAIWDEEGRYPNMILELLSPTTAEADRTTKMRIYESTFHTFEYFLYDPVAEELEGYRQNDRQRYRRITPEENRLWCESLGCWLGRWTGTYQHQEAVWVRMFEPNDQLVLVAAEAEAARAEAEATRAENAEAELARLKAELESLRTPNP